ncbi:HTH-type transcriptional activator RhaS [Erwinia psidii]|uniref:Arabinose operon regulatory protein n=1 Tax=Erwinia psidii TaxID=69224 RepID=A0A3N6URV9_9GAMM|nr:HTH-type transcriptional activator RhaS [Erwinia psidii]MCX8956032.1 HTH-type transcriptional activator RhaS [Erwinia psidii]MCX8961406.1 HTH-type transcriptional activator RhaS [Erwinia psidii]MCX8963748.1 HTH-type transcriptional activator RhaS [Erwinia psidii]RQM38739.1 HTH-type transcriptional activator RhaS [Erwinia psidii]
MTVLHSVDFFPGGGPVAIEPRVPQNAFPEHYHDDFHEIVIVEQGAGIHIFNGEPKPLSGGCVCFVRSHDRHLYEKTDRLVLTNVLYREPDAFRFITGFQRLLPQESEGNYPYHWRINNAVLEQVRQLIDVMKKDVQPCTLESQAGQEMHFMQLLLLLRNGMSELQADNQHDRMHCLLDWLAAHYSEEVDWEALADQFSLSLRTLHRQLKQQTGSTPQRYLNRLRLLQARHLLRHSEMRITDIAFHCGFGDSNHFSTLFKREFGTSPRTIRQNFL